MKNEFDINEFTILQNPIIGSHLMYEFMKKYNQYGVKNGISIQLLFCILPILFTKECLDSISNKNFKIGSFIKFLNNDKASYSDINSKMQFYSDVTLNSLNIAFSAQLLSYEINVGEVNYLPINDKIVNPQRLRPEYKSMIAAAQRLGAWFGVLSEFEIVTYLKLEF